MAIKLVNFGRGQKTPYHYQDHRAGYKEDWGDFGRTAQSGAVHPER
jgi:hypothetical protein